FFFFFSSRRRHTRSLRDWSSDVCSSDLLRIQMREKSAEIQDILVRLDKDLGTLFAHLDAKVGRGNYVVAPTADHGVVPVPEDMRSEERRVGKESRYMRERKI